MITLFNETCIFDEDKNKTIVYGQYYSIINKIDMNFNFNFVLCKNKNDFYIEIDEKINHIDEIYFFNEKDIIEIKKNINLTFPFEQCDLTLNSSSAIISTMCKDYSSRLEEWIEYNLNLGFSGIVIFNNDGNQNNSINEPTKHLSDNGSTHNICKKYKGKVWEVKMNYQPRKNNHWNTIQRITLHIGVNAFRNKCAKIALIDADEFIYLPKHKNIKDFCSNYKGQTVTIQSNILTNKSDNDVINNNILDLCLYVGVNKYTKTIIDTTSISRMEFIITPHYSSHTNING